MLGPLISYSLFITNSGNQPVDNFYEYLYEFVHRYVYEYKFDYEKDYDYQIDMKQSVQNPIIWEEFLFGEFSDINGWLGKVTNYTNGYSNNTIFIDQNQDSHHINNLEFNNLGYYESSISFTYNGGSLSDDLNTEINDQEIKFIYRFSQCNIESNNFYYTNIDDIIEEIDWVHHAYENSKIGEVTVKKETTANVFLRYYPENNYIYIKEYEDIENKDVFDEAWIKLNKDIYMSNLLNNFVFFQFWIDDGTYNEEFLSTSYGARVAYDKFSSSWWRTNGTWTYDWNRINGDQSVNQDEGLHYEDEYFESSKQLFSFMIMGTDFEKNFAIFAQETLNNMGNITYNSLNIIYYLILAIGTTFLLLVIWIMYMYGYGTYRDIKHIKMKKNQIKRDSLIKKIRRKEKRWHKQSIKRL